MLEILLDRRRGNRDIVHPSEGVVGQAGIFADVLDRPGLKPEFALRMPITNGNRCCAAFPPSTDGS